MGETLDRDKTSEEAEGGKMTHLRLAAVQDGAGNAAVQVERNRRR